jgi:ABC-type cobalamin/Fe3+-siderophores transport system ATPase subunit
MDSGKPSHILSVQNVCASYGKSVILKNFSLSVHSGEVVCITGPNGSGKSTLLSLLAGIVPDTLHIDSADEMPSFDDTPVVSLGRKEASLHIAYMIQDEKSAWNYTGRGIILTGRYAHTAGGIYQQADYDAVDAVIAAMGLDALAERRIFSMSGGEAQKVRIARALAQEPDMLLLDEPVANLDFGYQAELLTLIKKLAHEKNFGVLVSIHDLNTASRFADRIALLPRGRPCIEGPAECVLTPDTLADVYNVPFGVFTHPVYGCPQVYTI